MPDDFVSEAECSVCGDLDPGERVAMREELTEISLREPICEKCLVAFWTNIGFGPMIEEPSEH